MTEHWQIITTLVIVMGVLDGLSLWAMRFVVARAFAGQRDQYRDQLAEATKRCTELTGVLNSYQGIERQVLELKAVLPLEYVRKEDFIRHEVVINAKLDRIMERLPKGGNQCQ